MPNEKLLIRTGAISGILACIVDVISSIVLGSRITGYNHLRSPLSQLGIQSSPVAKEIAFWWDMVGVFMIIFGIGLYIAYRNKKKPALTAAILLMLYGLGEGLGSGFFPADKAGSLHSGTGIFHIIVGSIGVSGLAIFPLIMPYLISGIRKFSMIIFIVGISGVVLFMSSWIIDNPNNFINIYRGFFQRLFITNYYIYIIVVAIKIFSINK